jgi:hypothetical protein
LATGLSFHNDVHDSQCPSVCLGCGLHMLAVFNPVRLLLAH